MDEHAAGAEAARPQVFQCRIAGALAGQQQHQHRPGATGTGQPIDHLHRRQLGQLHAQLQRTQAPGLQEGRQSPRGMGTDVLPPLADPVLWNLQRENVTDRFFQVATLQRAAQPPGRAAARCAAAPSAGWNAPVRQHVRPARHAARRRG
ncbi:hypothetical protein G6F32_015588 [Rhizopus arrhizus]|nr:hypothetical protein G6F32_015588 [Rhizopus arrhizus]